MEYSFRRFGCFLIAFAIAFSVTASAFAAEATEPAPSPSRSMTIDPEDPEAVRYLETVPEETESEDAEPIQDLPAETEPAETVPPEPAEEDGVPCQEFPLYSQLDYPNKRFGSGTVATSGCGITSLAMVASYLTGHAYYPDELAGYFGGYGENNVQRFEYGAKELRLPIHKG